MPTQAKRIDVHHHFLPPDFLAHVNRKSRTWTGTGAPPPAWSLPLAREVMERHGIAAAVASVVPQVYWGDAEEAKQWARQCNEFLATVVQGDRRHFGGFATLPLPDTGAACRELEYALDVLKLDGVLVYASNGARYLGHPDFEELMKELNRRAAIVFIHPNTMPPGSEAPQPSLPYALVEFVFDTTRCVANLLYSGCFERYPAIKYILSHAGGTIPYVAWRLGLGEAFSPALRELVPKGVVHYLKGLYYDTALSASEPALAALQQLASPTHILFGSDFPLASEKTVQAEVAGLEASKVIDVKLRRAIDRENALRLFPRFA